MWWDQQPRRHRRHHPLSNEQIAAKLDDILKTQVAIMADLTRLNSAVAANTTAVADVSALVVALQSSTDQTGIDAAATQIEANNTALNGLKPPVVTPST